MRLRSELRDVHLSVVRAQWAALAAVALLTGGTASAQQPGAAQTRQTEPAGTTGAAQSGGIPAGALRVCADPSSLPQSNDRGEGYENKIAEALAHDLGKQVQYTFFPQRMGFVRNTLRARDDQTFQYKCDLIIGVPKGYDLTATTRPYMHSTYALVVPNRPEFKGLKTPQDLLALPSGKLHSLRIGIFALTPASDWLLKNNLIDQAVVYAAQSGDPKETPNTVIDRDLGGGKIDVAVVWGPVASLLVSEHQGADGWQALPFQPDPSIRFDYEISMGIRQGEKAWQQTLDDWIGTHQDQIHQILVGYHIPLLALTETPHS